MERCLQWLLLILSWLVTPLRTNVTYVNDASRSVSSVKANVEKLEFPRITR
jgi:hypothetical protein